MNPPNIEHSLSYISIVTQLIFWFAILVSLSEYSSTSLIILDEVKNMRKELHNDLKEIKEMIEKL